MPFAKRQLAEALVTNTGKSIGRAFSAVTLYRTAWHRRPRSRTGRDRAVIEVFDGLVPRKLRWGFWKLYDRSGLGGGS